MPSPKYDKDLCFILHPKTYEKSCLEKSIQILDKVLFEKSLSRGQWTDSVQKSQEINLFLKAEYNHIITQRRTAKNVSLEPSQLSTVCPSLILLLTLNSKDINCSSYNNKYVCACEKLIWKCQWTVQICHVYIWLSRYHQEKKWSPNKITHTYGLKFTYLY